ncbi:hypothetical protein B0H15DRAFT_62946 [Mycena belliarum]|uniref:Uncharacterized protein n=1 Tax=Mycena belliarum TaxID=1033014 RepID=A0AAD6XLN4_9AGAR|nr:hypothetical protein B0H15DRAFT_62946 [Mycena belliae]
MKTEPTVTELGTGLPPAADPVGAAAAALVLAMDQERRALVAARNAPSPALVAAEAKCAALEAEKMALETEKKILEGDLAVARAYAAQREAELATKGQELKESQAACSRLGTQVANLQRGLADARLTAEKELQRLQHANTQSENDRALLRKQLSDLTASSAKERASFARERESLDLSYRALGCAEDNLREDHAVLADEQERFYAERRANIANLKRTVSSLQSEVSRQEHLMPPSQTSKVLPARKRQRL